MSSRLSWARSATAAAPCRSRRGRAAAATTTKPRLKKVKIERTGPLRRSTREGLKKGKGFSYSQQALELKAWRGTGTQDDPYDAR